MQHWLRVAADWCQFRIFMQDKNRQREITQTPPKNMPFPRPCVLLNAQSVIIFQSAGGWWPHCWGGGLHWLLLKQGVLVRDFSFPLLLCLSHFISPSKTHFESFHLMGFPSDCDILPDRYSIIKHWCPHCLTYVWGQRAYQAKRCSQKW